MADRSYHITQAEKLLKEWEETPEFSNEYLVSKYHTKAVELLMAAQAHATLAESMRVLEGVEYRISHEQFVKMINERVRGISK